MSKETKDQFAISDINVVNRELKLSIKFQTQPFNVKDGYYHKEGEFELVQRLSAVAKIEFWRDGTPWMVDYHAMADYERAFPYELGRVAFEGLEPYVYENWSNGAVPNEMLIAWTKQIYPIADEMQRRNMIKETVK